MRDQPSSRPLEQDTWPVCPRPAQRIQPAGEPKTNFTLCNFDVAVASADFSRMLPSLFADAVDPQTFRNLNAQLIG